ncbi:MAG: polymer-forming cytoskeletal protein, partial [Candidatus Aminicenantes bacterium]|nr:polymer-forming cytoskeletal protein [Candidatus Aminicenantes bacterium]
MKFRTFVLMTVMILAAGGLLFGRQDGIHKGILVEKDIHVGPGEAQDNIVLLGGNALIDGRIKESVVSLGGRVLLNGTVEGDLFSLGGRVELGPESVVLGDVACIGGVLTKNPGCRVEGDTVYIKISTILPRFAEGWKGFFKMTLVPFILVFKLIMVFVWLVVTLIVINVIPQRITLASNTIRSDFGAVLGTGVLGLAAYGLLFVMAALLCLFLIGIPILLALLAAHFFITVFGKVAVYHFFGDSLFRAFGRGQASPLAASLLGLLAVSFITFLP